MTESVLGEKMNMLDRWVVMDGPRSWEKIFMDRQAGTQTWAFR